MITGTHEIEIEQGGDFDLVLRFDAIDLSGTVATLEIYGQGKDAPTTSIHSNQVSSDGSVIITTGTPSRVTSHIKAASTDLYTWGTGGWRLLIDYGDGRRLAWVRGRVTIIPRRGQ